VTVTLLVGTPVIDAKATWCWAITPAVNSAGALGDVTSKRTKADGAAVVNGDGVALVAVVDPHGTAVVVAEAEAEAEAETRVGAGSEW
jgi:hypothetical protein